MSLITTTSVIPRSSDSSSSSDVTIQTVFFTFQLFGVGGHAIILLTAAITRSWKHPTWVNFCVTWIISGISYSLLVGRPRTYVPPFQLCFAQAVLIYTVPTLTASATLALVIHVFRLIRLIRSRADRSERSTKTCTILLVVFPYLAACGMMTLSLIIGLRDPHAVRRTSSGHGVYCNMSNEIPGKLSAALVTIIMLICIVLEAFISRDVKRQWTFLRSAAASNPDLVRAQSRRSGYSRNPGASDNFNTMANAENPITEGGSDETNLIAMTVKVLVFSVFSVFAVALGIIFTFASHHDPALNIVLSLIPVAAVLVFGTQRDLLLAWGDGFRRIFQFFSCCGRPRVGHSMISGRKLHCRRHHASSTGSTEKMLPAIPVQMDTLGRTVESG